MSFYYLATPYSKYADGIEAAFRAAAEQTALLIRAGVPVYSPIAHTHPVAIHGDIDPYDHTIWLKADRAFMDAACGLIICTLPGWRDSYGIEQERQTFEKAGKPIYLMEPGIVPDEVLPTQRQIVGLCGYATSGKDTAAMGLIEAGWTRVALADGVRDATLAFNPMVEQTLDGKPVYLSYKLEGNGWDYAKINGEIRRLLQRMGTEAGRNIHGDDCWIKLAKRKIDAAPGNVVITDVRFANEAEAIRSWGGKVIRIDRPGVGPVNGHASESLDFEADLVLRNVGTIEELQDNLRLLVGCVAEAAT